MAMAMAMAMAITDNKKLMRLSVSTFAHAHRRSFSVSSVGLVLLGELLSYPLCGFAQGWKFTPLLSGRQTYSDNITLGSAGREQDAFVSELNPGFTLTRDGSRSKLDLSYRLQSIFYEGVDFNPRLNNQLQMNSHTELIDESVFLDSSSSIGQVNTSSTGFYNFDNLSAGANANTSEFRTFRMSPYWRPHFGRYLDGEVRVTYGNFGSGGGGTASQLGSNFFEERVQLRNGDATLPFGYRANFYNQDMLRNESAAGNANDVRFQNYNGELSYRFGPEFNVFVQAGHYENQFQGSANTARAHNGSYVTPGLAWTPSPKLSVAAGYGINNRFASVNWNPSQRTVLQVYLRDSEVGGSPSAGGYGGYGAGFGSGYGLDAGGGSLGSSFSGTGSVPGFGPGYMGQSSFSSPYGPLGGGNTGTTWNGLFQHKTRNTIWNASYGVSTTTIQQILFDPQVFSRSFDAQGNLLDPRLNSRFLGLPDLRNDIITSKRAQVSVTGFTAKNSVTLTGYQETRNYGASRSSQDVLGLSASWNWRITQRMSSTLTGIWQQVDGGFGLSGISSSGKNEYWNIGWQLNRQLSSFLNGALEVRHFQQDAGQTNRTYNENRITASLNVIF